MARKLVKRARLTNRQLGKLIDLFVIEVTAVKAAEAVGVNRNTAQRIYTKIRETMVAECEAHSPFKGEVEVDESYFGGKRKGERGRSIAFKVPVFGILKRNGKVYTQIVEDVSRYTLHQIIQKKVKSKSIVYSDSFVSYDGLVVYGYKHYRIDHRKVLVVGKHHHINGIENFWGYAKTRLRKYHGINRKHFNLYLKEMEFRFNNRKRNLRKLLRYILKINS